MKKSSSSRLSREELDKLYLVLVYLTLAQSKFNFSLFFFFPLFLLCSEEDAKKSIYSVSTKYYYAFGCKFPEDFAYKIRSLPNVKWVLPDSYLCHGESGYGGEPFADGEVVPYNDKYHADWIWNQHNNKLKSVPCPRKARRKRKKN
ncbi:hypothetical protein CICLE_v10026560mg [Citrus x clementina]|uniref:MORF/ORRM1/DAG-like MORF domain-containing protein n=1 Tax=Citrus clementina TaxID=85681 RepID=V4SH33_CITCL|nr:hypothetical protein CICLE_v10026560mg [Citrus x clementina]